MTSDVEHCPICKRACPEYEYAADPFWHDKTICKECCEKMPCAQAFEKALASGELYRELDRLDREERRWYNRLRRWLWNEFLINFTTPKMREKHHWSVEEV
jgi:hypothetical protein